MSGWGRGAQSPYLAESTRARDRSDRVQEGTGMAEHQERPIDKPGRAGTRREAPPWSLAAVFDTPAAYAISIAGGLDPAWSDRLQGLCIRPAEPRAEAPLELPEVTELRGTLRDQAALFGVLVALYELGLPLLTVTRLPGVRAGARDRAP